MLSNHLRISFALDCWTKVLCTLSNIFKQLPASCSFLEQVQKGFANQLAWAGCNVCLNLLFVFYFVFVVFVLVNWNIISQFHKLTTRNFRMLFVRFDAGSSGLWPEAAEECFPTQVWGLLVRLLNTRASWVCEPRFRTPCVPSMMTMVSKLLSFYGKKIDTAQRGRKTEHPHLCVV